jgi:hypothetical protein
MPYQDNDDNTTGTTPNITISPELELLELDELPGDERLLATALQGLINRSFPSLYLVHSQDERTENWLGEFHRPYRTHRGLDSLLEQHLTSAANGLIIYDPTVPDSINVAVTVAGLEQCLPASTDLAQRLENRFQQLPIFADLRGRFSSGLQAYQWQFDTLWPRCAHDLLVGISPTLGDPPGLYGGRLQDYAVAHRAMAFWLDPNVPNERTLLESILQEVPPCTPYLGWFPQDVAGEFSGTELTSTHGVYVVAADYSANLTTLSERRPAPSSVTTSHPAPPDLQNNIYVTFSLSEGDNLQYMQHRMRRLWDDPARGQVPINWSINPLSLDLAPTLLDYYLRTRSSQDCLIAGPSGAGYCYPSAWPEATFGTFTRQTAGCMHRLGLQVIWILNRIGGKSLPLNSSSAGAYVRDISPLGILLNYESYTETSVESNGLPQAVTQGIGSVEDALGALGLAGLLWDGTAPLFLSLGVLAWTMTPSDIAAIVERFTPPYQAVRADEYFQLVRRAHNLP